MPDRDRAAERPVLLVSIVASAILGALGIVWGIASRSQMILLDGAYAFVGIVLSGLLLFASSLSEREPSRRYPFGMEAATPLAIFVQGAVLTATLLYAAYEAVLTIRDGGSDVTAGWAIAYGIVVTVASVAVAIWMARVTGSSDLLASETAGWRVAAWRGVGMVAGFALLAAVDGSSWSEAGPYIDPVMVLVSCVLLVGTPVRMVRTTLTELLEGAPPDTTRAAVEAALAELVEAFGLRDPVLYSTKVGPKLYVELEAAADPTVTIAQVAQVREDLHRRLADLPYELWLTVELTPAMPHEEEQP
jgi:cation diffusion facilitator family transporter